MTTIPITRLPSGTFVLGNVDGAGTTARMYNLPDGYIVDGDIIRDRAGMPCAIEPRVMGFVALVSATRPEGVLLTTSMAALPGDTPQRDEDARRRRQQEAERRAREARSAAAAALHLGDTNWHVAQPYRDDPFRPRPYRAYGPDEYGWYRVTGAAVVFRSWHDAHAYALDFSFLDPTGRTYFKSV